MDGGMRPNFPPRFDGPDFFRGPHFDDHHMRHRRDDRRRMGKPDMFENDHHPVEIERAERRSRWGNTSPKNSDEPSNKQQDETKNQKLESNNIQPLPTADDAEIPEENTAKEAEKESIGNTTPLHDEPQETNSSMIVSISEARSAATDNSELTQVAADDVDEKAASPIEAAIEAP